MCDARAVRYRRLALVEPNPERARILRQIADEADRGVLCVSSVKLPVIAQPPTPIVSPAN
jgi:BarA-like signal transduction histidine kinase